ncbi:MAG: hypothetical protein M3M85_03605 [bacterium]|nr:hypothetical protein [bacterium]
MATNIDPANEQIKKALKDLEEKDREEALRQVPVVSKKSQTSNMADWLVKHSGGRIKEESGALYVLAGLAILALAVSLILILSSGPDIPKEALQNPELGLPQKDD